MSTELAQILAVLAETFGTTIDRLWDVMLWQMTLEGLMGILAFGAIAVIAAMLSRWCTDRVDTDDLIAVYFLVVFIIAIALPLLSVSLLKLLNPEYYALKMVLEALAR